MEEAFSLKELEKNKYSISLPVVNLIDWLLKEKNEGIFGFYCGCELLNSVANFEDHVELFSV